MKSKSHFHQLQAAFEKKQGAFFLFHRTLLHLGKKYSHLHLLFIPFFGLYEGYFNENKRPKTGLFCIFLHKKTGIMHVYAKISIQRANGWVTKCKRLGIGVVHTRRRDRLLVSTSRLILVGSPDTILTLPDFTEAAGSLGYVGNTIFLAPDNIGLTYDDGSSDDDDDDTPGTGGGGTGGDGGGDEGNPLST